MIHYPKATRLDDDDSNKFIARMGAEASMLLERLDLMVSFDLRQANTETS